MTLDSFVTWYLLRIFWTILFFFLFHLSSGQVDPLFSMYLNNTVMVNPAYAGSHEAIRLSALQRWQWVGIEGAPSTSSFTASVPVRDLNLGTGVSMLNDEIGPVSSSSFAFDFAYHLKLSEEQVRVSISSKNISSYSNRYRDELKGIYLSFGFKLGLNFNRINFGKLHSTTSYDPALLSGINNRTKLNLGFGLYLYSARYYLGLGVPRLFYKVMDYEFLNQPKINFRNQPIYLNGGIVMDLNPQFKFKPTFMLRYVNGIPPSLDLNADFIYENSFSFGFGARLGESVNFMMAYWIHDYVSFAYNYDLPVFNTSLLNGGTHEISITVELKYKKTDTPCQTYF